MFRAAPYLVLLAALAALAPGAAAAAAAEQPPSHASKSDDELFEKAERALKVEVSAKQGSEDEKDEEKETEKTVEVTELKDEKEEPEEVKQGSEDEKDEEKETEKTVEVTELKDEKEETKEVKQGCFEGDTTWEPLNMFVSATPGEVEPGKVFQAMKELEPTKEKDMHACQKRCKAQLGCLHFSYWRADGLCHLSDVYATRHTNRPGFVAGSATCSQEIDMPYMAPDPSTLAAKFACLEQGVLYSPVNAMPKTVTGNEEEVIEKCQKYCGENPDCEHMMVQFPVGTCLMAGKNATKVPGILNALAGPPSCDKDWVRPKTKTRPASGCFEAAVQWEPLDMGILPDAKHPDKVIQVAPIREESIHACQEKCRNTDGCAHFSFWKVSGEDEGFCHFQDAFAVRRAHRPGFTAGPPECESSGDVDPPYMPSTEDTPKGFECAAVGQVWSPIMAAMSLKGTESEVLTSCREHCKDTAGCAHVTVQFPMGLCQLAKANATIVEGILGAISAPVSCPKAEEQEELAFRKKYDVLHGTVAPSDPLPSLMACAFLACLAAVTVTAGLTRTRRGLTSFHEALQQEDEETPLGVA